MSEKTKYYFGKYENGEMVTRRGAGTDFLYSTKTALKLSNRSFYNYETGNYEKRKISVYEIEIDLSKAVQIE